MPSSEKLLEQVEDRRPALVELGLVVVILAVFVNLLADSLSLRIVWWQQVLLGVLGIGAVAGFMYWYSFSELFVTRATIELIVPLRVTWDGPDRGVDIPVIKPYPYTHQANQFWRRLLALRNVSPSALLEAWSRDGGSPGRAGQPPRPVQDLLRELTMLIVLNEVSRFGGEVRAPGGYHGKYAGLVRLLEDLEARPTVVNATPPQVHAALAHARGMPLNELRFRGPDGLRVEALIETKGPDAWLTSVQVGKSGLKIQVPRYWSDCEPRSTTWRIALRLFRDSTRVRKALAQQTASLRLARANLTLSVRLFSLYSFRRDLFRLHFSWLGELMNHLRSALDWQEAVMQAEPLRLIADIHREMAELRQSLAHAGSLPRETPGHALRPEDE